MIETKDLPVEKVHRDPEQPRQTFDEAALLELAESIKSVGLINPITVRQVNDDEYVIVQGERRWRAHLLAGLETIRCQVDGGNESRARWVTLTENLQREDVNPVELARYINNLMEEIGLSVTDVADRIGKSRPWVSHKLRLLGLPDNAQSHIGNELSEGHGRQLLKLIEKPEEIERLTTQAIKESWSVSRLSTEVNLALVGKERVARDRICYCEFEGECEHKRCVTTHEKVVVTTND
jgi:ParB family chromosome partitioning protein